jgi:hypothetical protein
VVRTPFGGVGSAMVRGGRVNRANHHRLKALPAGRNLQAPSHRLQLQRRSCHHDRIKHLARTIIRRHAELCRACTAESADYVDGRGWDFAAGMPVILAQSQGTVVSDVNGLASFAFSTGGILGNVAVMGSANVGTVSLKFAAQQLGP